MSEQAILNEFTQWDDEIQDCMTPDYGFTRNRPSTRAVAKPAGGRPWSREVTNTGHTFSLSWINRSYKCVQRVKYFVEQYEDGFFTIIDHDGGGRHYVGRFTGDYSAVEVANDKYSIQGLVFEELPAVPMIEYPADWDNDAIQLNATNDFGDVLLALVGTWILAPLNPADPASINVLRYEGGGNGTATYEYRGYGFRLYMAKGPSYGMANIALDGIFVSTVDLYAAVDQGLQMVLEMTTVMLDLHRLKVMADLAHNSASSGSTIVWGYLQVMR